MLRKTKKRKNKTNNMGVAKNKELQDKREDFLGTNDRSGYILIFFVTLVIASLAGLIWPTTFSIASMVTSYAGTFFSFLFDEKILKKKTIIFLRLALTGLSLGLMKLRIQKQAVLWQI